MDQSVRFELPRLGVTDAPPYTEQVGTVCPPDAMRNAWPREAGGGRWNLGTRARLTTLLTVSGEAAGLPIQAMGVVGTASAVTGYSGSNVVKVTGGTNRNGAKWSGQAVVLDADWTVRAVLKDARGTGGAMNPPPASVGGHGAFACCWHSTNDDVGYFCCIGEDTSHTTTAATIVLVDRFDLSTTGGGETPTHQAHLIDKDAPYTPPATGPYDAITCSQAVQIGPYLFVAARHYLYAFRADTLAYLERMAIDFAIEGQTIAGVTIGGVEYLVVGSTGSALTTGAVVADSGPDPKESFGEFGRACVALYKLAYADAVAKTAVAVGDAPLVRVAMPQGTESGDDYYEDHRTFRVSEWGRARPRGCLLYSMAVAPNGDVFIARTGQGFGCDGTQSDSKPDGAGETTHVARASLQAAYAVAPVAHLDPATATNYGFGLAAGGWERAIAGALVRPYIHGATVYQTDIPKIVAGVRQADDATQAPNAFAIAYAAIQDVVCVGGNRLNPTDHQLAAFRGLDGAPGWTQSVGAMVPQNAIAWDPLSGHFVVGAFRNKDWPGAAGAWAELFQINVFTGQILKTWSLTNQVLNNGSFDFDAVSPITLGAGVYAVAVNRRGQVLVALAPFRQSA